VTKATQHAAPVLLLWGEDPFLLREAALAALGDVRAREVDAGEWQGGELQDLATPSLFGDRRALLVTDCRSLPKEAVAKLAAYLSSPDPQAPLVLACTTAERGKAPAALLKLVEPVGEIRQVQLVRKDLEPWLVQRAKTTGLDLTPPAARALVETLGEDAGALAAAVQQLAGAFAGQRVGPAQVREQFRGLGEQKTWDLCDKAFGKDLPGAIRALRSIEEGGDDALMILGGIASRLRDLIRVRSLPERLPAAQVAKEAGLRFEWQARRYQQQARNFSLAKLVVIHGWLTEADRALKSGAQADVVMPALVTAIAAA
jgi:DNA polymerase-3 subunit delta